MKAISLKSTPNQELISGLENLLQEAKAGKLRSFVAVTQFSGGDLHQLYCLDKGCNDYAITGCLNMLVTRMSLMQLDNSERMDFDDEEVS